MTIEDDFNSVVVAKSRADLVRDAQEASYKKIIVQAIKDGTFKSLDGDFEDPDFDDEGYDEGYDEGNYSFKGEKYNILEGFVEAPDFQFSAGSYEFADSYEEEIDISSSLSIQDADGKELTLEQLRALAEEILRTKEESLNVNGILGRSSEFTARGEGGEPTLAPSRAGVPSVATSAISAQQLIAMVNQEIIDNSSKSGNGGGDRTGGR